MSGMPWTASGRALLAREWRDEPTSDYAIEGRRLLLTAIVAIENEARAAPLDVERLALSLRWHLEDHDGLHHAGQCGAAGCADDIAAIYNSRAYAAEPPPGETA